MDAQRPDLDALREQIDRLDRTLLETLRARNEVVLQIARAKKDAGGHPLFDRQRERAVYERAERHAQEIGLAPDLARDLVQTIVEASHRMQEWVARERAQGPGGEVSRRILIVGGAGRMGRRFATDFSARGHVIDVLEPGDPRDPGSVVGAADVVMISVPMAQATAVASEIGRFVRRDAILCDLNSLKRDICAAMERSGAGEVVGLHPMFGPSVHSLRRQKIVICPVREGPHAAWLRSELASLGLEIVESTPDEHDRMMAVVQVLTHYSTIVMGAALERSGLDLADTLRFTSPIYRLELAFVGRLFAQDPDLYAEIEMTNPDGAALRKAFLDAANEIDHMLENGDRRAFRLQFEDVASWFRTFSGEAMTLSNRIIDWVVRAP